MAGISALSTLKGDVDNLGTIFQSGLGDDVSFSKTAALSRQINAFFTVYCRGFVKPNTPRPTPYLPVATISF